MNSFQYTIFQTRHRLSLIPHVGLSSLQFLETLRPLHQLRQDPGFAIAMPCVRNDMELGLGPAFMELPGSCHRADDIVSSLDDPAGDAVVANRLHVIENPLVGGEEALIFEADGRECNR